MEGHCSTGQSPQWAVVSVEEEGYLENKETREHIIIIIMIIKG